MSDAAPASATAETTIGPELLPSVAKANDLEAIRKSVEDAASVSGSLWISYLFLTFYLAIAAGAVSHVDLFIENPVKLPFLSIELPLKAFFLLAPLLFCISHVYTMTYFVILSDKAKRYHRELNEQIAGDADPTSDASVQARDIRNELQRQLPSNIFVQFLAGPEEIRSSALGFILKAIAWTTLVFAPILLLLLLQVQFLPYHDHVITWVTRLSLLFDMAMIWWLWRAILLGRGELLRPMDRRSFAGTVLAVASSMIVIYFSWAVAIFPGEAVGTTVLNWPFIADRDSRGAPATVSLNDFLFHRPVSTLTRRRGIFLSSTLVLPLFNVAEYLKKDPQTFGPFKYVFRARGRDLRGAVFELSNLSNVDFEGADLDGASLDLAELQNASFNCAHLDDSSFFLSKVQGAWFHRAQMRDVEMINAQAQGARFEGAQLERAVLTGAAFQGASFNSADLAAANLAGAHLDGVSLRKQDDLGDACVKSDAPTAGPAIVPVTDLQGAVLTGAFLPGATFRDAELRDATLQGARLDATDLTPAQLAQAKDAPDVSAQTKDGKGYQASLAAIFQALVCPEDPNALFVLRGLFATGRLTETGPSASALVGSIEDPGCKLSGLLSLDDKADLHAAEVRAVATAGR